MTLTAADLVGLMGVVAKAAFDIAGINYVIAVRIGTHLRGLL